MSHAIRHVSAIKSPPKNRKYSIIIPAAGMGRRMITYGPVSLLNINNKRIIDRQISTIAKVFNYYEIILVTGFQSDRVINNTPNNICKIKNLNFETTNVLHSIGIGLNMITTNRVVILYGDLIFNLAALNCPFDKDSAIVICDSMKKNEVGSIIDKNFVQSMCYDIPNKWAHIAYFTGMELELLKKISLSPKNQKMFGFEAINNIIDNGGKIKAYIPKKAKAIDIDTSKDIELASKI